MSDLKIALLFEAMDRISPVAQKIDSALSRMGETFEKTGGKIAAFGERMSFTSQIIANGAEEIQRWADKIIEPAAGMEDAINRLGAISGMAAPALANVREQFTKFAEANAGDSAEQLVGAFTQALPVFRDVSKAIQGTEAASKLAYIQHTDTASELALLGEVYNNLGTEANRTADMVMKAIQVVGIAAPEQFTRSVGKLSAVAYASHSGLAEVLAIAGEAGKMMPGRGQGAIAEMFNNFEKAVAGGGTGIDTNATLITQLGQLQVRLAGLSDMGKLRALKDLGLEADPRMLVFLDHLGAIRGEIKQIDNSSGALNKAWGADTAGFNAQAERLGHVMAGVAEAIGGPALGTLGAGMGKLADVMQKIGDVAQNHPAIAKWFTISLAGAGALGIATSRIGSALGTALSIFGHGYSLIGSALLRIGPILSGIGEGIAAVTGLSLGAVAGVALAIAAVGVIAYEIYKHWQAIHDAGVNLMKALGAGILAGIEYPIHAIAHVAEAIGKFVIGKSPPPMGPLHDLNRIRIVETIAAAIRPAPAVAAMAVLAGAIATAPMPANAGGRFGGPSISINLTVNFNGGHVAPGDPGFERQAREHAYLLADILEKEMERRARRRF